MSLNAPQVGVQLGRFAPFHRGHQKVTEAMIQRYGSQALVLIGSPDVFVGKAPRGPAEQKLMRRTPFTEAQRETMIRALYPELRICTFPDTNPDPSQHDSSFRAWVERLKELETSEGAEFHFVGGSEEDLRYLAGDFPTECIVERSTEGEGINATELRGCLDEGRLEDVEAQVDARIVPILVEFFRENLKLIDQHFFTGSSDPLALKLSLGLEEIEAQLDAGSLPEVVELLKRDLGEEFESSVGVWEGYTLGEHTKMVLGQFQRYFRKDFVPPSLSGDPKERLLFEFVLALHDIGKPLAVAKEAKELQHFYTTQYLENLLAQLNFSPAAVNFALGLIWGDPVGEDLKFLFGDPKVTRSVEEKTQRTEETVLKVRSMAAAAGLSVEAFWPYLLTYFQCDASSYTKDAGGKESLDKLFVFVEDTLRFASPYQERVEELRLALRG